MKNDVLKIFNFYHKKILGSDAGAYTVAFAKNVSVSLIGGLSAFFLLFIASIIAARVLGPEEYGKYAVFLSAAQFLSLLFVLELDVSALYFLSSRSRQKEKIVNSILVMFLINIFIFSFLAFGIYHFFDPQNVPRSILGGAIVMALSFSLKRIVDAFLRSEKKFKIQSLLRIFEACAVLGLLLVLFHIFDRAVYTSYVQTVVVGGLAFSVTGIYILRRHFSFSFDAGVLEKMSEIFRHNSYGLMNAFVNGIIKNADKMLVATLLGLAMAGTYAVYFTASVVIGARVTQIVMNVFFPSVRSDTTRIAGIYKKINTIFQKTSFLFMVCASGGVWSIVFLYGPEYERSVLWIILGGTYITVHFFASLYGWLLSSVSSRGYKLYNASFLYGFVGYGAVIFFALILGQVTITVFLSALVIYRAVSGAFCFYTLRDHL